GESVVTRDPRLVSRFRGASLRLTARTQRHAERQQARRAHRQGPGLGDRAPAAHRSAHRLTRPFRSPVPSPWRCYMRRLESLLVLVVAMALATCISTARPASAATLGAEVYGAFNTH